MIKALLGPNGSGKSTYLRKLIGLQNNKIDLSYAMVFQEPLLFDMSVCENISLGLRFRKSRDIKSKVDLWLDKLQISHLKHRHATQLSGGEAQKAALARALVLEPQTLLLDEPFANLDLPSQLRLREEIKAIIKESKMSAIWVTHNKAEALAVADELMIMLNFEVAQEGRPEDVLQRPENKEIADFLGIENIFHGRIEGSDGRSFFVNDKVRFEVVSKANGSAWVIVHPEDIIVSGESLKGTSARNSLSGTVTEIVPSGLAFRIKIDAGEIFTVAITRISAEELGLSQGKKVFLTFKATAVQIL